VWNNADTSVCGGVFVLRHGNELEEAVAHVVENVSLGSAASRTRFDRNSYSYGAVCPPPHTEPRRCHLEPKMVLQSDVIEEPFKPGFFKEPFPQRVIARTYKGVSKNLKK